MTKQSLFNGAPGSIPHLAEDILPGHPDRVADAVAERIVDRAVEFDPDALVGVEVAVFRGMAQVTGRIAAGDATGVPALFSEEVVHEAFRSAGYRDRWTLLADGFWGKDENGNGCVPRIQADLELGALSDEERAIRGFSDDQNFVVGHASRSEATGWLPPAPFAARRLREALGCVREEHADVLGPDGKVLVRFFEQDGKFRWDICNIAIQHVSGVGYESLHRLLLPALESAAKQLDTALPGLASSWSPERVRVNGGGDFSCGGPHGDNGLSGKKLVVDHFGPGVPIGGGALCGKDPHKVDRAGALRARQLAVRLVRDAGSGEATVRLGFLPGLREPAFVEACVDGEWWDADRIGQVIAIPDLSLEGTFQQLELGAVCWSDVAREGYFGNGRAWER